MEQHEAMSAAMDAIFWRQFRLPTLAEQYRDQCAAARAADDLRRGRAVRMPGHSADEAADMIREHEFFGEEA